jgi:hypothetical protein
MFHYIENKNYNLKNNEYEKFKNISNQNSLKPIQQPVQNFNIYNNFENFENFENFNQKQEQSFQKLESQNRDPTDVSFDKLKYYRNNDLEKFKEIQGGFLIN